MFGLVPGQVRGGFGVGFLGVAAGGQLRSDVRGPGVGALGGSRRRLGRVGGRAEFDGGVLSGGGVGVDGWAVGGPVVEIHGCRRGAVCVVDERYGRTGAADRRSAQIGHRGLRNRVHGHRAAAGDRGESGVVGGAGGHEHSGPEHPGDHGHRGAIHRDVGSGRGGDVRLRRCVSGGNSVDTVQLTATDDQPWRYGQSSRHGLAGRRLRGRPEHPVPAVAVGGGAQRAAKPRVGRRIVRSGCAAGELPRYRVGHRRQHVRP